jgi:hypothetical protein
MAFKLTDNVLIDGSRPGVIVGTGSYLNNRGEMVPIYLVNIDPYLLGFGIHRIDQHGEVYVSILTVHESALSIADGTADVVPLVPKFSHRLLNKP